MFRKLLILILPLVFLTALGWAVEEPKEIQQLQKESDRLDSEARQSGGNQAVLDSISKQLNIPVSTLQTEQQNTQFGFGQLFIANSIAQASGKSFDQVTREFKAGKGWGQIANDNNVKLGSVVSGLKQAGNHLKSTRRTQMRTNQANRQGVSRQHAPAVKARGKARPR